MSQEVDRLFLNDTLDDALLEVRASISESSYIDIIPNIINEQKGGLFDYE